MADKETEELEFHRQTITGGGNSPLHLIREKEIEISGRILAAKRSADEIVSTARREAVALIAEAQGDASHIVAERELAAQSIVEKESASIRAGAEGQVAELEASISDKTQQAVSFVVDSVVKV